MSYEENFLNDLVSSQPRMLIVLVTKPLFLLSEGPSQAQDGSKQKIMWETKGGFPTGREGL